MAKFILAFSLALFTLNTQAQPHFSDTSRNLGTIAQGAKIPFSIWLSNPDSFAFDIKLEHICGCTEFVQTNYTLTPCTTITIPITYHSSGNAGEVKRGFYVKYSSDTKKGKQKVSFHAFIDTINTFTAPVLDTNPCYRFDRTEIDCGTIIEGTIPKFVYTLYNCSQEPLVINQVRSSCGCVTPEWSRGPIQPGKTTEIKAHYNSNGRPGTFCKSIYVDLNVPGGSLVLLLKGFVISQDATKQ